MFHKDGKPDAKKIGLDGKVICPFRGDDALPQLPQSGHYIRESFGVGRALQRFIIDGGKDSLRSSRGRSWR
jgi:hypothetical protein